MRRRELITFLGGAAAWPLAARAQQREKVPRIGVLSAGSPATNGDLIEAFRQGLRELGYLEGRNIEIEYLWADGKSDQLPGLAAELVRRKVDVIFAAGGTEAILAAKGATATLPIVMAIVADPIRSGIVDGLARPGGNITGLSNLSLGLNGKRLELLKELLPKVSKVAILWNSDNPGSAINETEFGGPARSLGIMLQSLDIRRPEDLESAFSEMHSQHAEALFTVNSTLIGGLRKRIADLAIKARLPAIGLERQWPAAGAFMSYGPSYPDQFHGAAAYVDKILKGAKPGDLPIQQPTKFELVVNVKTAKAIGLKLPESFLLRADEVIE
jgi:putative ABC transport system substrate-binding protein